MGLSNRFSSTKLLIQHENHSVWSIITSSSSLIFFSLSRRNSFIFLRDPDVNQNRCFFCDEKQRSILLPLLSEEKKSIGYRPHEKLCHLLITIFYRMINFLSNVVLLFSIASSCYSRTCHLKNSRLSFLSDY